MKKFNTVVKLNENLVRCHDDPVKLLKGYDLADITNTDIEDILVRQYDDDPYNVILAAVQYSDMLSEDNGYNIAIWKIDDDNLPQGMFSKIIHAVWFTNYADMYMFSELFKYLPDSDEYSIKWPTNMRAVDDGTFIGARRIKEMRIPNYIAELGYACFKSCINMTKIYAPTVRILDDYTFYGCIALESVKLSKHLTAVPDHCFYKTGIKNLDFLIDRKVESIGPQAFGECIGLVDVTVPASVSFVDNYAFASCINLKSIRFLNPDVEFGKNVFAQCKALKEENIKIG